MKLETAQFKKLTTQLLAAKNFLLTLLVVITIGYTGYQLSRIVNLEPDQASIEAEQEKLRGSRVRFDKATIDELNSRSSTPKQPNLSNLGKADPFSP